MRLIPLTCAVAVLLRAGSAHAQSCDATFSKKGNPVTGLKYTAIVSVADLSTRDAINQIRGIVVARGYDVLAAEPDAGDLLMEMPQAEARRSFPIVAKATVEGSISTIQLRANLRAGVFTNNDSVKAELCGMLGALKGGAAGVKAAEQGLTASATSKPTVMSAQMLADRVSKERDQNVNEIALRYKDRAFTLDGLVSSIVRDGDRYTVIFDILSTEQKAIRAPGESQFKTDIVCQLAPGQSVYALTLKPRTKVTLTGTYSDYRASPVPSMMWLSNCTPAK